MRKSLEDFMWIVRYRLAHTGEALESLGLSILWYLKQLLPLTYRTTYIELGIEYFVVWNMWFGTCFNADTFAIGPGVPSLAEGPVRTENFTSDKRKFVLQQDIIIARGTVFMPSSVKTERMPGTFYGTTVGLSNNTAGFFEYECPNSEVKNYFKEI